MSASAAGLAIRVTRGRVPSSRARRAVAVPSPAISTVLRRPPAPATIVTAPGDTPNRSARNRTSSALAAHPMGGAATRSLIVAP
jgi:hypothetical protein